MVFKIITYLLVAAGEQESNESLSGFRPCPHRDGGCETGAIAAWNGADGHWVRDEGEVVLLCRRLYIGERGNKIIVRHEIEINIASK